MELLGFIIGSGVAGAACTMAFLFGFGVGATPDTQNRREQLANARRQAMRADRELHNLTREAFIAMSEAAERRAHGTRERD